MKKEEEMGDFTDIEEEYSLAVGNALQLVVKGSFAVLRENIKNGQVRSQAGQTIMAMQMATGSATVAYHMRISPDLMKQYFDEAYFQITQLTQEDEKKSHYEPGNA